jgi:hypothetical protein
VKEDMDALKKRWEQIIDENMPSKFRCWYDSSTGEVDCHEDCPTQFQDEDEYQCPEMIYNNMKRALSRLSMRRFLTRAFFEPNIAKANNLLPRDLLLSRR